jgi:predicted ArsR family transcriptional regulator
MPRNNLEDRALLAVLIGPNSVANIALMLCAYEPTIRIKMRELRMGGYVCITRFEHRRNGAPRAFYGLTVKGQTYAKELIA